MKWTAFILSITILASCTGGADELIDTYNRDKFFVVDYNQILDNPQQFGISDLNADVEYIKLETNENCLLHTYAQFFFTRDYIFVNNVRYILQFDRNGKFIKQIGQQGRGPGEIGLIRILSVLDEEQLLVVQTNWARKLYFFNYDGEFVENRKADDVSKIVALPGERLLLLDGCYMGVEDYMFMLLNSNGDTTDVVNNHYKWSNKTGSVMSVSYHLFHPFYTYGGDTYMKSMYNDTIYHAHADSISPEYLIELGSFKLPQENRAEVPSTGPSFNEKSDGYRFANSFEANEKLFIASQDFSEEGEYNMIYDRRTETGMLLVDRQNFEGGIINDYDGGIDFWPRGAANDSTLYMPVLPHRLLTEEFTKKIKANESVDQEKKQELLNMINDLDENDNPILMLVKVRED